MAKSYVVLFTVHPKNLEAPRDFPMDMLRYDRCVPATESDSYRIANALTRDVDSDKMRIRLASHGRDLFWLPHLARWESFGWTVAIDVERRG